MYKIKGWVARPKEYFYKSKLLNLFIDKPEFDKVNGLWTGDFYIGVISDKIYPNLKLEDGPKEVIIPVETGKITFPM